MEAETRRAASSSSSHFLSLSDGRKVSTSYGQNGRHVLPVQSDPLMESLDEEEEVEVWLNKTISSQRSTKDASVTALQLRGIDSMEGTISSQSSYARPANLENYLSSLSSTLSFARQDTMTVIDSTISEVSTSIPRLGLELRLMKDAALTLKGNVDRLRTLSQGDVSNASSSTQNASAALERLSALSMLHTRMSSARDVLSLAESWSTLAADVTSYLNEAKLSRASLRLAEARKTLAVFERTPEYESRKVLLERLCESLVSGVRPLLENAIKERDLQRSQELSRTLANIGKEDQFANIWHKTRAEHWSTQWRSVRKGKTADDALVEALPRLIAAFLDLLNEEKLFAPTLFPNNPRRSMEAFVASTFNELEPPLAFRLKDALGSQSSRRIIDLVEIFTLLRDAVDSIGNILLSVEGAAKSNADFKSPMISSSGHVYQHSPSAISPSKESNKQLGQASLSPQNSMHNRPRQGSHNRKSSRRLSIPISKSDGSTKDVFNDPSDQGTTRVKASLFDIFLSQLPAVQEWETCILQPMLEWQVESIKMESDLIAANKSNKSVLASMKTDEANSLGTQFGDQLVAGALVASESSKEASRRIIQLTFGFTADSLVTCCEETFCNLLEEFKQVFHSRSGQIVEYARRQAGIFRDGERDEGIGTSSSVEATQWRSFEDGVTVLSSLHQVDRTIVETENMLALQLLNTAEMLLAAGTPAAKEAILHVCGNDANSSLSSRAPLALLARHLQEHLQSNDLLDILTKIRHIAKGTRPFSLARDVSSTMLFTEAHPTLRKQVKSVQQHIIDITLAPLLAHMEAYTQLAIWQANRLPGSVNEYELAMPTFSLSPTEEMSKIGEGLLNLPRLLEVWSDNETLRWAMQELPFVATEEEKRADASVSFEDAQANTSPNNKRSSFHATVSPAANPSASPVSERRQTLHRHSSSVAAIATQTGSSSSSNNTSVSNTLNGTEANASVNSTVMLQTYLSSIALSLVSHIVSLVLPSILKLTSAGSLQLVADLEYLLNILSALNVNSAAMAAITNVSSNNTQAVFLVRTLEAWKDSCKLKDEDGQRIMTQIRNGSMAKGIEVSGIDGFEEDTERLNSLVGTQVFDMVAKMRSW